MQARIILSKVGMVKLYLLSNLRPHLRMQHINKLFLLKQQQNG